MTILDILNSPWAILESKLEQIVAVYERHAAGEKLSADAIKVAIGSTPKSGQNNSSYLVDSGVAIVPVHGVLAKKMNLFMDISGGMSTEMIAKAIADANQDPSVHSILLDLDSPGGEVDGTQAVGNAVAASEKPIIAFVDGLGCSAAYWIASQADGIYAASDTSTLGSISVVLKHVDSSKANEASGRTVTYITTGKYKAAANGDNPLSQDDRAYLQDKLNYLNDLFVNTVAEGRGKTPDQVWADMGEGRTFFAQQALSVGMIDGIMTKDALIQKMNADVSKHPGSKGPGFSKPGATTMFKTFATEADYNAALNAEFERGQAAATTASGTEIEKVKADAYTAGATAERERIKAVESTPLASAHKDLIATMKFDGKSTQAEAAVAVLAAEEKVRGNKAKELAEDAGQGVDASAADPTKEAEQKKKDAEAAAASATEEDPKALAGKITAHMAAAAKDGRKLTFAQAQAEVSSKK